MKKSSRVHRLDVLLFLALVAYCAVAPRAAVAVPGVIFQSAVLGPIGHPLNGTFAIDAFTFLGVKFELVNTIQVTAVGGHVVGGFIDRTLFVAVVPLDPLTDLPSTFDLADALFADTFTAPELSDEVTVPTDFQLNPGRYALLFGSGLFGATGQGGAPGNNGDIGSPQYIFSDNTAQIWRNGGFDSVRFFLLTGPAIFADGFESGNSSNWTLTVN